MSIFEVYLNTNRIYPDLSMKYEEKGKNLANFDENSYIRLFKYKVSTLRNVNLKYGSYCQLNLIFPLAISKETSVHYWLRRSWIM